MPSVQLSRTSGKPAINRGFPGPPHQVGYFARRAHRTQKVLYYYQFIIKDTTQGQPDGRDAGDKVLGKEHRVSKPQSQLPAARGLHQPRNVPKPVL